MTVRAPTWRAFSLRARANTLEERWQKLCALYLPRAPQDSMWRYHEGKRRRHPSVGWKLHISATILNAPTVLKRIAPLLVARGVRFKAPRSLEEVVKLNSGLYYSYAQIGKIVTIYPSSDREAVYLARQLHELTRRLAAPSVPFDLKFAETSNVYYRFGAFKHIEMEHEGRQTLGMHGPDGRLVPDIREQPKPDWVSDPFEPHKPQTRPPKAPPSVPLRVIKVLAQRGKGGVYEAIDFSGEVPRLCLLKEGRKNGELAWDGRDGAWRVRHEERVLSRLSVCGLPVPQVLDAFERGGNYYLVMEHLSAESLYDVLLRRRRRIDLRTVLDYGIQLATFLSQMHSAGWAWRDCKPKNILVTREHRLVPIDFEGATPIRRPDRLLWGTPGFTPPEWGRNLTNIVAEDRYALGAMIYLLLTSRLFDHAKPTRIHELRRNVYPELRRLVESLLADDPRKRPSAKAARASLVSISLKYSPNPMRLESVKAA